MRESLPTVSAFEGLLSGMYPDVLLQVVFEFECFPTFRTLELAQVRAFVVADHVTLKTVNVRKSFITGRADL